jgi:photosystem II stability/assembly factor-like uncharacterized protein
VKALAIILAAAFLGCAFSASAASGRTYVLWIGSQAFVTRDGSGWRDVTPRGAVSPRTGASIDGVVFSGSDEGWLIASNCASGKGAVYRTHDRGRSWNRHVFHAHTCAAGANFVLDVLDRRNAWVVQNEPTGPFARLYRTRDGGSSWRKVSESLPDLGTVAFANSAKGWLAGRRLFRTVDGGKTWSRQALAAPRGYRGKLRALSRMTFFGRTGIVAGEYYRERDVLAFYRTADTGRHWRLMSTLPGAGPYGFPQFTMSAVSASTIWLLTSGAKPVGNVTTDGGRSWSRHPLVQRFFAPVALSARVAAASNFHGLPYITRDGGRTWRLLRL